MLTIIASLILSLFFFQSSDKERNTDRDYDGLNGLVRLVRIETQQMPDRTGNPRNNERELDKIILYNLNGMMSEEISFGQLPKDCTRARHKFSYTDKNSRTETLFWGQSVATGKPDTAESSGPPLIYKQEFKLDGNGRRLEIKDRDDRGNSYKKESYKYDDRGRVKEIVVEYNDSVSSRCEFKYNDKGLPSEESCKGREPYNSTKTTYAYEYDRLGNWIKRTANIASMAFDGSPRDNQVITYREFKFYPSTLARPEDAADSIDSVKIVPCRPLTIRKSGGVLQASAIRRAEPAYPPAARDAGVRGAVIVELTVNEAGKVVSVKTISGPSELRAAAEDAAKGWEFRPTTLSKIPARVIGTITFNFNL